MGPLNPKGIVSSSPGLPRPRGYPGSTRGSGLNPIGVASHPGARVLDATPLGLGPFPDFTQSSSILATLGSAPESLWDSSRSRGESDHSRAMLDLSIRVRSPEALDAER